MVLIETDERSATLRSPLKARPPVLVAIAFWLAAPLPLIVPDRSGFVHYAFSILLVAIGVALALNSLRRPAARLEFGQGVFRTDERARSMTDAREVVLTGAPEDAPEPLYRAELIFEGGQREVLLEYPEPARVLHDLSVLLPRLKLPVRLGWGLPEGAVPWEFQATPQASVKSADVKLEPITVASPPSARRPALALIIGAFVLAAIQVILITSGAKRASNLNPLSLALPMSSAATVLLLGLIVWTRRIVVRADRQVAIQVRIFGLEVRKLAEVAAPIGNAWPVSPRGGTPHHVLIATRAGPVAVPCEGDAAAALAGALKVRAASSS